MKCYQRKGRIVFEEQNEVVQSRMRRFRKLCFAFPVFCLAAWLSWQLFFVGFDKGVEIYFAHKTNCKCSRVK